MINLLICRHMWRFIDLDSKVASKHHIWGLASIVKVIYYRLLRRGAICHCIPVIPILSQARRRVWCHLSRGQSHYSQI